MTWWNPLRSAPARVPMLVRRALWPVLASYRRLRDREPLLRCSYEGLTLFYPARSEIGTSIASGRGWDAALGPIVAEILGDDSGVVADVGSNIGASLLQMQLAAPQARYVCFEPSARFLSVLRRNVRANGWSNVRIEPVALGAESGRRTLFVNPTTASIVAAAYGERAPLGAQLVKVTTLDRALGAESRLDFVKIDTDGFELDLLRGGRETLHRRRPALFFEFDVELLAWAVTTPASCWTCSPRPGTTTSSWSPLEARRCLSSMGSTLSERSNRTRSTNRT